MFLIQFAFETLNASDLISNTIRHDLSYKQLINGKDELEHRFYAEIVKEKLTENKNFIANNAQSSGSKYYINLTFQMIFDIAYKSHKVSGEVCGVSRLCLAEFAQPMIYFD